MLMRYYFEIDEADRFEDPTWQCCETADEADEADGLSATDFGRTVLQDWITDHTDADTPPLVDEYGNPKVRIRVYFQDDRSPYEPMDEDPAAVVGCNELAWPSPEIEAVEQARTLKLYGKFLSSIADHRLEEALKGARAADHGVNDLARRVAPAVSRPIALRMMAS